MKPDAPAAALAVTLCLLCAPAAAQRPYPPHYWDEVAMQYAIPCSNQMPDDIKAACYRSQEELQRSYNGAMRGVYVAQRNMAAFMEGGEGLPETNVRAWIKGNRIQACAWRWVVVSYGHEMAQARDAEQWEAACGRLSPNERVLAQQRAERILKEIREPGPVSPPTWR